jgi:hypothetical protein
MVMERNDVDDLIRRSIERTPLADGALDRAWASVDEAMKDADRMPESSSGRVRRTRHRRLALVVAAATLSMTGVALGSGELREFLFPPESAAPEVSSLQRTDELPNEGEYEQLQDLLSTPAEQASSALRPRSESRVLEESNGRGRVLAAPTENGDVCLLVLDDTTGRPRVGGCLGAFPRSGIGFSVNVERDVDGASTYSLTGLAADDVESIHVVTDASRIEVDVRNNVFQWSADVRPLEIHVQRAGRSVIEPVE